MNRRFPEDSPPIDRTTATGRVASPILDALNAVQQEAVAHPEGPLLVLAGAGSGKTRVITHRIAHLIVDRHVDPTRIVAVTFTNKAAGEMRDRVEGLLGSRHMGSWIGTFHALCLRILRRDGARIGREPGFNVYDTGDQISLVRRILHEEQAEDAASKARPVLTRISRAKNALESPEEFQDRAHTPDGRLAARVFPLYQEALRQANAVDFDDLLLRTLELFREHREVADLYADRCQHLLVDEYQDTNRPQYKLVRALSSRHGNVCAVGDEDQSIYRFRGAEIRNILEFEEDHPGTRVIKLEQNYRSTGTILKAAGSMIRNNQHRKGKTLWTENTQGEKIELFHAFTDRSEAAWVSQGVRQLAGQIALEEMAILYRTNAQSRQFEEIFRRDQIPYQVVGSVQFYERKEVKDLLAYLKLVANPADDVSFRRIVNTPARGIGNTTTKKVEDVARAHRVPMLKAAGHALDQALLPGRSARMVRGFLDLVADLVRDASEKPVPALLDTLVRTLDYEAYLERTFPGQGTERMENARALVTAAVEYHEEVEEPTLQGFLDRSALVSDADQVGARAGVTLMTIHCAKGLEFSVVFLAGLEENLFPHSRSVGSAEDMEEERRLCYVALTRAKQRLFLSHAGMRRVQGLPVPNPPSRFLGEIPAELVQESFPDPTELVYDREIRAGRSGGSAAGRISRRNARSSTLQKRPALGMDPGDGFPVGASVVHPLFGGGFILARQGSGKSLKLTIHFSEHGEKKILPAYTKLRVHT